MPTSDSAAAPEQLLFMAGLVTVHLGQEANRAGASLLEHRLAEGFSPPLHVHADEDETFYVLHGRVRFEADGVSREVGPSEAVHIPAGMPHSFRVLSPGGARFLTLTHGGFEAMIRDVSPRATGDEQPACIAPTPAMQAQLAGACRRRSIELLGPPLA